MVAITFNTLTFAKRLKKQGMSEGLAEEVAIGIAESREVDFSNLVTKDYLHMKLESDLEFVRQIIKIVEATLKQDIVNTETRILTHLTAMVKAFYEK